MDIASSRFNLDSTSPIKKPQPNTLDSSSIQYQEEIAKACGLALDKRILSFNVAPPVSEHYHGRDELKKNWNR